MSHNYWERVKSLLKELKEILPKGYLFEIVADRGFQGDTMFQMCKELGIDFIIRINDSYKVRVNGQEYIQLSLFNDGYYITESLGKENQTSDINLCVNSRVLENGEVAKWYLVSNRRALDQDVMVERYSTRFWIEEGILVLKYKVRSKRFEIEVSLGAVHGEDTSERAA